MSTASQFPVATQLARRLFPVFWNEYLFRLNSCRRKDIDPATADYFVVSGATRSPVLIGRFYLASLLHLILLLFRTQKRPRSGGPIFLFTNLRHGRFFSDHSEALRVGLYNLRYLQYPHLLAGLSIGDWLRGFGLALTSYPAFRKNCQQHCAVLGEDWQTFRSLAFCGRLRHLDAVLHAMALEKHGGEVWCPGHFDLYVFIASELRERGALTRLVGCQHGLFEHPPTNHRYEGLYADTYFLLFEESRRWVEGNFLKNPDCTITLDAKPAHIPFQTFDRAPGTGVVAFAAQEIAPCDEDLIERLLTMKEHGDHPLDVLLYTHPLYPCENADWIAKGLKTFSRERHDNIDVLITRFSTLGLDYHRLGTPVLFVPFDDRVCIFADPAFTVCPDLDSMETELKQKLDWTGA